MSIPAVIIEQEKVAVSVGGENVVVSVASTPVSVQVGGVVIGGGSPTAPITADNGLPPGGEVGSVLTKASPTDYDGHWQELPEPEPGPPGQGVPAGGTAGQHYIKASGVNYDGAFEDLIYSLSVPANGDTISLAAGRWRQKLTYTGDTSRTIRLPSTTGVAFGTTLQIYRTGAGTLAIRDSANAIEIIRVKPKRPSTFVLTPDGAGGGCWALMQPVIPIPGATVIDDEHQFLAGKNPNATTLVAEANSGVHIWGAGPGNSDKPGQQGLASHVYRSTSSTEPMIASGAADVHIHDLALWGYEPWVGSSDGTPGETRPSIGIYVHQVSGPGTGEFNIHDVSLRGMDEGIVFGSDAGSLQCDNSPMTKVIFRDMVNAIVTRHSMALRNNAYGCSASYLTGAFYRVLGGGNHKIDSCSVTQMASDQRAHWFHFGTGGSNISSSNRTYHISNCKIDMQCDNRFGYVRMDGQVQLGVVADNCCTAAMETPYGDGNYLWDIFEGIRVMINAGTSLMRPNSIFVNSDSGSYPIPVFTCTGHELFPPLSQLNTLLAPGSGPIILDARACSYQEPVANGRQVYFDFKGLLYPP